MLEGGGRGGVQPPDFGPALTAAPPDFWSHVYLTPLDFQTLQHACSNAQIKKSVIVI